VNRDIGALRMECAGDGGADASCRTGYEGDVIIKTVWR